MTLAAATVRRRVQAGGGALQRGALFGGERRHQGAHHLDARRIHLQRAGLAAGVAALDAPAFGAQIVVALVALQVGEFGPGLFGVSLQQAHGFGEPDRLPDGPGALAHGGRRGAMVRGLGGGEGIEFEGEIGVAGGDQFVIHLLPRHAEMAGEAGLGADLQILGIDHAGLDAGLVRILAGVRAEPLFGGAVTGFAGHAIGARLFGRARDVADGAALVARGVGDAEDLRHAFAARLHQGLVGAGVFVGDAPVGVLIAQDAALAGGQRGGAAVAVGGGAAAGSDVPMRRRLRQRASRNRQQN